MNKYNKDLMGNEIEQKTQIIWKLHYLIHKFDAQIKINDMFNSKIKKYLNLSNNELLLLKTIIWSERITIIGLSNYLNMQAPNVKKVIDKLISRDILLILKDGTLLPTKQFYSNWRTFLELESTQKTISKSIMKLQKEIYRINKILKEFKRFYILNI
ncbi:MAG: hypothetical protein GY679_03085 [Mycoplasma sp.]|nr:hypothetical protein [Mycoplasma sp.]